MSNGVAKKEVSNKNSTTEYLDSKIFFFSFRHKKNVNEENNKNGMTTFLAYWKETIK